MKKLGDYLTFKNGKRSPVRENRADFPVMGSNGCIGYSSESNIRETCIVIGRVGSYCGNVHFAPNGCWVTDNAIAAVPRNPEEATFWFGYLENLNLNTMALGSGQPLLTQGLLREITASELDTQQKVAIGRILGALDDKIAVNRRVLQLANELIQNKVLKASLGSVFVPLREVTTSIVRGVIPKYSDEGCYVVNQKCIRDQSVSLTGARYLSNFPKNESKILKISDVLVNSTGMGTLGRAARWTNPLEHCTADSHVSIVRFSAHKADPDFAGALLVSRKPMIEDLAEGSTGQTELRRDLLGSLELPLPDIEIQRNVGDLIRTLDESNNALTQENQVLARTRDELLPLLMNGKISVAEANEAVEGVVGKQEEGDGDV